MRVGLDFSAFGSGIIPAERESSFGLVESEPRSPRRRVAWRSGLPIWVADALSAVVFVAVPAGVIAGIVALATGRAGLGIWFVVIQPLVLFALVALVFAIDRLVSRVASREVGDRSAEVAAFARTNGFEYVAQTSPSAPGGVVLSRVPHAQAWDAVRGTFAGTPFELASVGAWSDHGFLGGAYLALRLARPAPHLLLVPRTAAWRTAEVETFGLEERVDALEGDFPSRFTLYVPPGYGVDARYLLPPDVMAVLVGEAHDLSVETRDDWLVIGFDDDLVGADADAYRRAFRVLERVGEALRRPTARYRDHRADVGGAIGPVAARLVPVATGAVYRRVAGIVLGGIVVGVVPAWIVGMLLHAPA